MKKIIFVLISLILIIGCTEKEEFELKDKYKQENYDFENTIVKPISHEDSRFGFMHPHHFKEMQELPAYWQRPHPGNFIWDRIEQEENDFDWREVDYDVRRSQQYNINIVATIWPFADWEQANCREELSRAKTREFPVLGKYRQKPCDLNKYKNFVKIMVERYDGDGNNDMPGLKFPIKYWEVGNEPSFQDDLVFFVGPPADYFEVLKTTYEVIKEADPNAQVLQGGMAHLESSVNSFWQEIFNLGGADYFDIANIHSIGMNSDTFYAVEFNEYLEENDIEKPFWVTEAVLVAKEFDKKEFTAEEWAEQSVKSFVTAFAGGAEKIFYVGLEAAPGQEETWLLKGDQKQPPFYAFQTMISKLDYFTAAEKIAEGQFKFTVDGETVYVLWQGEVPSEVNDDVRVIDIYGNEVSDLTLDGGVVFVES